MTIDYKEIWASINQESKSKSHQFLIARRIPSFGIFNCFLATDFGKNIRLLLIKLDNNHGIISNDLPKFRGLEISLVTTSIGNLKNKEFLKFTQSLPNADNIFESVIADICDHVIRIRNKENLNSVLIKLINEWKVFFEKQEAEILSIAAQKGLFGELYFLKAYLFQKFSFTEAILFWTGANKTNHDFQISDNAVEVKTTSSKQHKKFLIASERQLDSTGLENLYLALLALNLHSNMPDKTLPALIRELITQIKDDSIATYQFHIKLAKYGYNEILSEKYKIGFSVFDVMFFEVVEGFPRLLQNNLPNGVGDLKYSVMVSACHPFELTTNILDCI